MSGDPRADLERRIEAIETGYEFMLAYAAQGRETEKGAATGRNVREYLEKMSAALEGLGAVAAACASAVEPQLAKSAGAFLAAVDRDAEVARAIVSLALGRADISSQLIDNMNASIHLRALLTDLFVIDEALRTPKARG